MKTTLWGGALLMLAALPACKSAPSIEPGAGLTVLREIDGAGSVSADDYFIEEAAEATYAVVAGKAEGETRTFMRKAADDFGASIVEELSGARIEFLRRNQAGDVVLLAVIDEANQALSIFEPPLVVMPSSLSRGEPFESRAAMRVVDARNHSKQKEHGTATRTVEYIGNSLVKTPIGEIECARLRITFSADLRMADAETTTLLYFAPGYGTVAEQWSEVVKVFGALSSEKGEVIVLATEPK